jgi:hypothetical protein
MSYLRRVMSVLIVVVLVGTLSAVAQDSTPTIAIELTETYTTGDGLKSFRYPKGWLIRDVHGTEADVANTQEALDYDFGDTFQPGVVIVTAVTARIFDAEVTPLNLLQSIYESGGEDVQSELDPPTSIQIDGRPAAFMTLPSEISDLQFIVIEIRPNVIGFVQLTTAPGELDQWLPTALAIAESITYNSGVGVTPEAAEATALPLTESYITENSMFGIDYPAGWTFETYFPPSQGDWILSANIRNGDALTPEQIFPPGRVSIDVTVTDIDSLVFSIQRESSEITAEDIVRFRWFGLSADQADMVSDLMQTPAANGGYERGSIETVMVEDHEAARVDMRLPGFNEGFALAYVDNDIVVEVRLITAPGELSQWTATALAIADGFGYFG